MKLIVGIITAKPGKRDAFMQAAREHADQTRKEPGCFYFELAPIPEHSDKMLLAEGFVSEQAHRAHEETDHMRALWAVMPELLERFELDNMAGQAQHIDELFGQHQREVSR